MRLRPISKCLLEWWKQSQPNPGPSSNTKLKEIDLSVYVLLYEWKDCLIISIQITHFTLYSSLLARTLNVVLLFASACWFFSKITSYLRFRHDSLETEKNPLRAVNLSIAISGLGYAGWYKEKKDKKFRDLAGKCATAPILLLQSIIYTFITRNSYFCPSNLKI